MNVSSDEISNNVTLVVEIGVGFIIAVIVYGISRKSVSEIEKKVDSVFGIVKERDDYRKKQASSAKDLLLNSFNKMKIDVIQVLHDAEAYEKLEDPSKKEYYKNQIILGCKQIKTHAEKSLDDPIIISPEFFDMVTMNKFKTLSILCKNEPDFNDEGDVNVYFCQTIKKMIQSWIDEFSQKIEKKTLVTTPEPIKLESNIDVVSISTSSDRTVYPLDSTMHMRANIGAVIQGEKITFEVFNSKRKLLLSQKIDPETYDHPGLKGTNIFEVSFKMEGDEWKVGEEYIVRATHSSSYSEDSFLVDQRIPIVQSDKSVYMINSDMILTVIDPDADKDNQVPEYVGDREDSKLIIESPYGKIDGYKLRETGDSTGIFQGIIGILGIRKDGSVIKQKIDGKIIDKIQGTGIDDGFIGGPPGQEITITYKNNTSTAKLSVFVSNFGVAIEMDQKVYRPDDKVYLTVVAPDFNFDSESIDEIGQKPEGIIRIRTGKDELLNYKLVETGPDTGIFTGELQLTKSQEKSSKSQTKFSPNDGHIACNNDDFIEVIFNVFGDEEIVGRAMIKS